MPRRKPFAHENIWRMCDDNAPEPCKNHQSYCDVLFPNGCPWNTCGDYLTQSDLENAWEEHCKSCVHYDYCQERGGDSLFCENYAK